MESSLEGWFTMILSGISVNIYVYCLSTKRVKVIDCLPNVAVDFFRYYCKNHSFLQEKIHGDNLSETLCCSLIIGCMVCTCIYDNHKKLAFIRTNLTSSF